MPAQKILDRITSLVFLLIIGELFVGGGGRLIAYGPVSLRMVLFGFAMILTTLHFISGKRISREFVLMLVFFSATITIGMLVGKTNDALTAAWWEDVKPLLYFLILPFFIFAVSDEVVVNRVVWMVKAASIFLCGAFFLILLLIHSGAIPFLSFYHAVINTGEFFFRGEITFFYKGFLFLCIGLIFFQINGELNLRYVRILLVIAIILTVTRGFWFALALTFAVYYFRKSTWRTIGYVVLCIAVLTVGEKMISESSTSIHKFQDRPADDVRKATLLGDRKFSDAGRLTQVKEVVAQINPVSIIIGHGFGNGIPSRPVHMEISYLEIFHKQGILGLFFWFTLFVLLVKKYLRAKTSPAAEAFFFSSVFVFIQSLTNQYVNNPIGLSVVLLSIVCLDAIKKEKQMS